MLLHGAASPGMENISDNMESENFSLCIGCSTLFFFGIHSDTNIMTQTLAGEMLLLAQALNIQQCDFLCNVFIATAARSPVSHLC